MMFQDHSVVFARDFDLWHREGGSAIACEMPDDSVSLFGVDDVCVMHNAKEGQDYRLSTRRAS